MITLYLISNIKIVCLVYFLKMAVVLYILFDLLFVVHTYLFRHLKYAKKFNLIPQAKIMLKPIQQMILEMNYILFIYRIQNTFAVIAI